MTNEPSGLKTSQDRLLIWFRVLAKRRRDCEQLQKDVLDGLLSRLRGMSSGVKVPAARNTSSSDQLEFLLDHHLKVANDQQQAPNRRRQALEVVKTLLSLIDKAVASRNQNDADKSTRTQGSTTTADKNKSTVSSWPGNNAVPNKNNAASQQHITSNKENKESTLQQKQQELERLRQQQQPQERQLHQRQQKRSNSTTRPSSQPNSSRNSSTQPGGSSTITSNNNAATATSTVAVQKQSSSIGNNKTAAPTNEKQETADASKTNGKNNNDRSPSRWGPPVSQQQSEIGTQPKKADPDKPNTIPSKENGGSASSTDKQQPTKPREKNQISAEKKAAQLAVDRFAAEKKAAEKRSITNDVLKAASMRDFRGGEVSIVIPEETIPSRKGAGAHSIYSGALTARAQMVVRFKPEKLDEQQAYNLGSRVEQWDPFWVATKYIACGRTSLARLGADGAKKMVTKWTGKVYAPGIIDWSKPLTAYHNDQVRLILQMIPVNRNKKKKSADGHKWPLGCFLTIDNKPIELSLRKQQEHDKTEWKGICKALDVTPYIINPHLETDFKICTYDEEPYYFCLAACKYRSPAALYVQLLESSTLPGSILKVLSREEGLEKALSFARPASSLDSDDDGVEESVGQFVFTLTCAYSGSIMQNPVRGKHCKHFQCFDLKNFLQTNGKEGGQRWRCGSCEQFLCYQDLELCEFSADLIAELKGQVTPTQRDRVLFSSDMKYELLPERKQRGKKRTRPESADGSNSKGSKQPKQAAPAPKPAAPEIILLDDD